MSYLESKSVNFEFQHSDFIDDMDKKVLLVNFFFFFIQNLSFTQISSGLCLTVSNHDTYNLNWLL